MTTSKELSERLKKLGVKQSSYFKWHSVGDKYAATLKEFPRSGALLGDGSPILVSPDTHVPVQYEHECAAFTSGELGEILRLHFFKQWSTEWSWERECWVGEMLLGKSEKDGQIIRHWVEGTTEQETRGLMLEYLLTNGLLQADAMV